MSTAVIFLKCLLLIASPIFITATDSCAKNETDEKCLSNYRLPPGVLPIHYDIRLKLYTHDDVEKTTFGGETNITIKILYGTQYISLHSLKLEINQLKTKLIYENGTIYTPIEHRHRVPHVLVLYFTNTLLPGFYTLCFKYMGYFSEKGQGFLKIPDRKIHNKMKWMFVTQFDKIAARQTFPCWDEPALKATFNVSVEHHLRYLAFSTMPIREERYNDRDLMVLSHFKKTPLMSTHLLGIAVIEVGRCNNDSIFHIWCRQNVPMDFVHNLTQQYRTVANHLIRYTKTIMKLPKLDIIIVPDNVPNNSSSWGMLLLKDSLITNENNEIQKINLISFIAHEMAKQWFGSVVGPTWWSDMWLSNGFALYFKLYILDQMYEEWRMMDFIVLSLQKCFQLDDTVSRKNILFYTKSTYETDFIESLIVADKTLVLLHMLKYLVTDKVFQNSIITYLDKYQFGSATPDDFWDTMQTVLNEANIKFKHFEIKEVMHIWLNQTTYPMVQVRRKYEISETTISHYDGKMRADNRTRWIPVTFVVYSHLDFPETMPVLWLNIHRSISVPTVPTDWIIVNFQQAGYYRVNYDAKNWEKIADCLDSDEFTKIHVMNRAQLIDDAYYFLVEKHLDFHIFLQITSYLSKEVDYIAWLPMFRILSYQWKFFLLPFGEPAVLYALRVQILDSLNGLVRNIGYEDDSADDGITKLMRGTALTWACTYGDLLCEKRAVYKLSQRIDNLEQYTSILPWETWIYCYGLKGADLITWTKVMDLYIRTHKDVVLEVLTCSENPEIVIDYFRILHIGVNKSIMTHNQHSHIFGILIAKYAQNDEILNYILQNLENVKPRSYSRTAVLKDIILNIYSEKQLNKTYEFFKQKDAEMSKYLTKIIPMRLTQLQNMMTTYLQRFM
ncbi:aminopeptidase N [Ooceraea biroi]|uniref:aminopeptidase N n=1 Tax=Ooceraea biroi TaxID=2015173 RepID=UPI000F0829A9|nr:aminopeptidase N [Ooceraea biroi]